MRSFRADFKQNERQDFELNNLIIYDLDIDNVSKRLKKDPRFTLIRSISEENEEEPEPATEEYVSKFLKQSSISSERYRSPRRSRIVESESCCAYRKVNQRKQFRNNPKEVSNELETVKEKKRREKDFSTLYNKFKNFVDSKNHNSQVSGSKKNEYTIKMVDIRKEKFLFSRFPRKSDFQKLFPFSMERLKNQKNRSFSKTERLSDAPNRYQKSFSVISNQYKTPKKTKSININSTRTRGRVPKLSLRLSRSGVKTSPNNHSLLIRTKKVDKLNDQSWILNAGLPEKVINRMRSSECSYKSKRQRFRILKQERRDKSMNKSLDHPLALNAIKISKFTI